MLFVSKIMLIILNLNLILAKQMSLDFFVFVVEKSLLFCVNSSSKLKGDNGSHLKAKDLILVLVDSINLHTFSSVL